MTKEEIAIFSNYLDGLYLDNCEIKAVDIISKAKSKLKDMNTKKTAIQVIEEVIIGEFGLSFAQLSARKRNDEFLKPRQISIYLISEFTGSSDRLIGNMFERSVSACFDCRRKIGNYIEVDENFKMIIDKLKRRITKLLNR